LLGALSENKSDPFRKRNLQASDNEDSEGNELDVKFNVGFGEDIGQKLLKQKKDQQEKEAETAWESYQRKRKEKRK
jgi:hypothetical protein